MVDSLQLMEDPRDTVGVGTAVCGGLSPPLTAAEASGGEAGAAWET